MSNYLELVKKVKLLADKGVGGEKENAERILEDLMEKYGVSKEQLDMEERLDRRFDNIQYKYHKLFSQIGYAVLGKNWKGINIVVKQTTTRYVVGCTKAEQLEI